MTGSDAPAEPLLLLELLLLLLALLLLLEGTRCGGGGAGVERLPCRARLDCRERLGDGVLDAFGGALLGFLLAIRTVHLFRLQAKGNGMKR